MVVMFMFENYSIVEPMGMNSESSKMERCWKLITGSYGIRMARINQFDPYTAMSRMSDKYIIEKFSIIKELPTLEWIQENISTFIRDEFSVNSECVAPTCYYPNIEDTIQLSDEELHEYLANSEWENNIQLKLPSDHSISEMAKSIYDVLCNSKITSGHNALNIDKTEFITQIQPQLERQSRLIFVIPGCPFKDQNRFRVPYSASSVDFCEIAFLVRLHNVIQALYQVHPYGATVIILSDGMLYKDIFYISSIDVEEYQWRLKNYRNILNIQGDVSIIDLKEMIERANANGEIDTVLSYLEKMIGKNCADLGCFESLIQGMKWNMNSKELLNNLSEEDAWHVIKDKREIISPQLQSQWDEYNKLATEAAIHYSAVNLMLKWTDLIHKFFPEAIRCTVHPKKGQFALTSNYAWNGVAWSEKWPSSLSDIVTKPFFELSQYKKVKLAKFRSNGFPCFYTAADKLQVFEAAKRVLDPEGWVIDDIFGREFTKYDLPDLYNLGKDDADFAWEHKIMSQEYYAALLEFRMAHYKKYGFGVHAIIKNGVMIGQMGLQVLNEEKQKLEYVIFLSKKYIRQGIGTKLLTYLFSRCKEERISRVYAVIRSDNAASQNLVVKFGGKRIKTIPHYKQPGILYEIKIK